MIFFYDANGVLLKNTLERVFQGSNKANTVYFVCPTAKTNTITLACKLPNGEYTSQHLMELTDELSGVYDKNDNLYSMWEYSIPSAITSYMGKVQMQFFINSTNISIATETASFMVEKGVVVIDPEKGDSYKELLNLVTDLSPSYEAVKDALKDINAISEIALKVDVEDALLGD